MVVRFLLAGLVALPFAATAQEAPRLLAVLSGDWNGDEISDAVILTRTDDAAADLILYQGDSIEGLNPAIRVPGAVFAGSMAGQLPELVALSATSFVIVSTQTGIGRTPWTQAITVAYRNGRYVVAGYDYVFYDRLDPSHYGNCSVNLLTSRYTLTRGPGDEAADTTETGVTEVSSFDLATLTEGFVASPCNDLFN